MLYRISTNLQSIYNCLCVLESKKQRMDLSSSTKNGEEDDECMFDSDSSLPEIPDAPTTPVEQRKFAAEQIFQNSNNSVR